ncbi:MAG: nitroreductase family protein [Planctomycetota bacterium]|jgi:nitroreductase
MDVFEAIKNRRSIRKYDPERPVSGETLDAVLDAARWAPSWANTQCVRYIVVRGEEKKKELAAKLSEKNPAAKAIMSAPVTVVLVAALESSGYYKGKATDDKAWHMFDAGLAAQNFCLAAHAMGLGTVISGAMDYRAIEKILGVPEGFQVVAMTPLGYPAKDSSAPPRKELDRLKSDEAWGAQLEWKD